MKVCKLKDADTLNRVKWRKAVKDSLLLPSPVMKTSSSVGGGLPWPVYPIISKSLTLSSQNKAYDIPIPFETTGRTEG